LLKITDCLHLETTLDALFNKTQTDLRPLRRSKTEIYDWNDIYLQICTYMGASLPPQSLALGLHLSI